MHIPPPPFPPPPTFVPSLSFHACDCFHLLIIVAPFYIVPCSRTPPQATLAFLSGDKALARKLSQQGRQAAEHMAAAHATAARRTVAARNPHLRTDGDSGSSGWCGEDTGVRGGGGPPLLDLHGLHVAEALSTLEDQLVELSSDRGMAGGKRLRVCVGMGRHSKTVARLPGAVKAALQEWGVGYREDVPGLLDLDLTGL